MAIGVPVVASARAAIPSTVADAGILIDDPDDPMVVASILNEVLTNPTLRHVLIGRGVSRAKRLSAPTSLPELVSAVIGTEPEIAARYRQLHGQPREAAPAWAGATAGGGKES